MIEHWSKYKEIAKKRGLSIDTIQKICDSQFEFVRNTMMEGSDQSVRLQYLGMFRVEPGKREKVKRRNAKIAEIKRKKRNG